MGTVKVQCLSCSSQKIIYLEYKCIDVRDSSKDRAWPQRHFTCSWSESRVATPDKLRKREMPHMLFSTAIQEASGFQITMKKWAEISYLHSSCLELTQEC